MNHSNRAEGYSREFSEDTSRKRMFSPVPQSNLTLTKFIQNEGSIEMDNSKKQPTNMARMMSPFQQSLKTNESKNYSFISPDSHHKPGK